MRMLLSWCDPGPDPHGPDPGPLMRLLALAPAPYEVVRLLFCRGKRGGARRLMRAVAEFAGAVELRALDIEDPSDHARLFEVLGPEIADLPPTEELDVLLSAGTPQVQTLWVVLVQAGLLNARMLQVIPSRFVPDPHPEPIREVSLDIAGFPEIRAMQEELVQLRARVGALRGELIGDSPLMQALGGRLLRVAQSDVPVLILGETGTGKELVARAIHGASERAGAPFVAENCGTFAEGVLQSELFGHEAGAFTGATGQRRGLFERAEGGTLFLDEVGELSPRVQVQLLRVLQEGVVRRVGGEAPVPVDVRVLAATHQDLPAMMEAGTFRKDLWYRLCGATLEVPALRERRGDLEVLVTHFLGQAERRDLRPTRSAWSALNVYDWPGNVRELQAEVRRWTVFCDTRVELGDLSAPIRARADRLPALLSEEILPLAEVVGQAERGAIAGALAAEAKNLSATARALGIDRNTLKRKLARYGLR